MANRWDVISVDKLWDIFDLEREKAWEGVDSPVGTPEWNIAAGKIDMINNADIVLRMDKLVSEGNEDICGSMEGALKDGVD